MYGGNGRFQYSKGNNSKSRKKRVMVHVFCTLSHSGKHLCEFHENMSSDLKLRSRHENC